MIMLPAAVCRFLYFPAVALGIRYWLPLLFLVAGAGPVHAQREYYNWYFGQSAGLNFNPSPPTALSSLRFALEADAACMSDSAGRFLFVTNGQKVWDRTGQVMRGGDTINLNGYYRSPVLAVRQPGRFGRYYIFRDGGTYLSSGSGLNFCVVDIRRNGGLGEVVSRDSLREWPVPAFSYGNIENRIVAVRHTNGRDVWVVWRLHNRQYGSCLLTRLGVGAVQLSRAPLLERQSSLSGVGNVYLPLKASADGKRLAASVIRVDSLSLISSTALELADFNPATGRVMAVFSLPDSIIRRRNALGLRSAAHGGLEFSPDGSRLYADTLGGSIEQYDLLAGSPSAIAASRLRVGTTPASAGSLVFSNLQLAPDGRIYTGGSTALSGSGYVARINFPNALGKASGYQDSAIALGGVAYFQGAFPLATNDLNLQPVVISGAGDVVVGATCVGDVVAFRSSLSPFITARSFSWNFGDPAAGSQNSASGQAPSHTFNQTGNYLVTVQVTIITGLRFTTQQAVAVEECRKPLPNIITPNGDLLNEAFVLRGLYAPDWAIRIYSRWGREVFQQTSYDNTWAAQGLPDGPYYYLLTNAKTGQQYKGWVEARC